MQVRWPLQVGGKSGGSGSVVFNHKGVYRPTATYVVGDVVTFGETQFLAQAAIPKYTYPGQDTRWVPIGGLSLGSPGPTGTTGTTGRSGIAGTVGAKGPRGDQGAKGPSGAAALLTNWQPLSLINGWKKGAQTPEWGMDGVGTVWLRGIAVGGSGPIAMLPEGAWPRRSHRWSGYLGRLQVNGAGFANAGALLAIDSGDVYLDTSWKAASFVGTIPEPPPTPEQPTPGYDQSNTIYAVDVNPNPGFDADHPAPLNPNGGNDAVAEVTRTFSGTVLVTGGLNQTDDGRTILAYLSVFDDPGAENGAYTQFDAQDLDYPEDGTSSWWEGSAWTMHSIRWVDLATRVRLTVNGQPQAELHNTADNQAVVMYVPPYPRFSSTNFLGMIVTNDNPIPDVDPSNEIEVVLDPFVCRYRYYYAQQGGGGNTAS